MHSQLSHTVFLALWEKQPPPKFPPMVAKPMAVARLALNHCPIIDTIGVDSIAQPTPQQREKLKKTDSKHLKD